MPKRPVEPDSVFLNIPYDTKFRPLYLAYIAGVTQLGLTPRATLGIPGGDARLDRIFELIRSSRYSIHDLSRVQLDRNHPATPRFNMPFELGLAIAWAKLYPKQHTWFVLESVNRRALKSISDLNGTDFNIHNDRPDGVMRELCNAFVRANRRPTVAQMMETHGLLTRQSRRLVRENGATSLYEARIFRDLVALAAIARDT